MTVIIRDPEGVRRALLAGLLARLQREYPDAIVTCVKHDDPDARRCPRCRGAGAVPRPHRENPCSLCGGTGGAE